MIKELEKANWRSALPSSEEPAREEQPISQCSWLLNQALLVWLPIPCTWIVEIDLDQEQL
jgi:hypothetical protein